MGTLSDCIHLKVTLKEKNVSICKLHLPEVSALYFRQFFYLRL
jgi:hypothetical protein